ncbi:MAG: ABC transporter permease [Acutalibacteraceae bacterium]
MKKKMQLCFQFFHKNILKSLALLIIMVSSCVILSNMTAGVEYYIQAKNMFAGDDIANSDYVSIYDKFNLYFFSKEEAVSSENGVEHYDVNEYNKQFSALVESDIYAQIKQFPAVDKVYSYTVESRMAKYNNTVSDIYTANMDTYKRFAFNLSEGCWFNNADSSSEYPNAVVCGPNFADVHIGDDMEFDYGAFGKYKVHIIGKVASPYATMDLNGDFSYGISYTNKIFLLNDEKTVNAFGETINRYPTSAIVSYKDNASTEEIEKCRSFYDSFFNDMQGVVANRYLPYEEMLSAVDESINYSIQSALKTGGVCLGAATLMFIIISALMIKAKQKEYNIYSIVGSTKKQNFISSLLSLSVISLAAGIISTIYLIWFSYAVSNGVITNNSYYYIGIISYLTLWGYLIINTIISAVIPYIMVFRKKMTLMTLYKKS